MLSVCCITARSSQKSYFGYFPWILLCEQEHLSPQRSARNWGGDFFFLVSKPTLQRPYLVRNLSVPKLLLEVFILLYRKAFLGDKSSYNLKLGWIFVLLGLLLFFSSLCLHTRHFECRSAPKPKHLSLNIFWTLNLNRDKGCFSTVCKTPLEVYESPHSNSEI